MKMRFDAGSLMMVDDERVKAAIDLNLRQLAADIDDRGSDGAKRSLTLQIDLTPNVHEGCVTSVDAEIQITAKTPPRRTRPISMKLGADKSGKPMLEFNDASLDDPRQGTLDEARKGESLGR